MARPANADAAATRRRILASASRRFSEHGPDGASIREIARDASVSLAMVHHYYGSKDGLWSACVESMYAELLQMEAELEADLARGGSLGELVERAVRVGFRFARSHQLAVRLLLRSVVQAGELDRQKRESAQRPFLDRVSERIGAAVGRPAAELRLPLQSLVALTARFGVSSERELELVTDLRGEQALASVENHLVDVARALVASTRH